MESLRDKLNECIKKYGTKDERTIKASQELDKYIADEQKKHGTN